MPLIAGNDRIPYRWFIKWVGVYSERERKTRLVRIVWSRRGGPGDGRGWSAMLSINLVRRWAGWDRDDEHLYINFLGVQFHKTRNFGGWIT